MKTNLKHIDEFFSIEENLKTSKNLTNWLKTVKISKKSNFYDDVWELDLPDLYHYKSRVLDWSKPTTLGYDLKQYPNLLETIKKVVFFLQTTLETRKKRKALSQKDCYMYLRCLADWMIQNKIYFFKDFKQTHLYQYINWLKNERINSKNVNKNIRGYIYAIRDLIIFNEYLEDKIEQDIFNGIDFLSLVKINKEQETKTKSIPNEVLEKICNKILPILDYFYENNLGIDNLKNQSLIVKEDVKRANGKVINKKEEFKNEYVIRIINSICYFTIGLYTGMRVSEMLSLKKECYEVDDNNVIVLNSTLFKINNINEGRPEKWGCGLNNENNLALKAIKILAKITPKDYENLFFTYPNKKLKIMQSHQINKFLNELMDFCEVDWDVSTHQLRKTFAKLIGITDKTCLVALKEHFKHASLAMTDYYVGTSYELIGMINEEKQLEITEGLDSILSSNKLAGKLGEKISKINMKFRGNVEARNNYIEEIIHNSDLVVVPHEYGFCIYQPEQAKCKGENKNIGLNTCTKCNNFAVSEKHKVFWMNRVEQYETFKNSILNIERQSVTVDELNLEIKQAKSIINKISGKEE